MKWFYMTFCDVTLGGPPGDEEREWIELSRSFPPVLPSSAPYGFSLHLRRGAVAGGGRGRAARGGAALSIRRPFKVSLSPHSLPSIEGSAL